MRESPDSPGPPIHAARSAEDRQFVTALARGLEVLRCFSAETPELGSREIARRIGLSQSTIWRLCHTLSQLGYLVPGTAPGKLRVGRRRSPWGRPRSMRCATRRSSSRTCAHS